MLSFFAGLASGTAIGAAIVSWLKDERISTEKLDQLRSDLDFERGLRMDLERDLALVRAELVGLSGRPHEAMRVLRRQSLQQANLITSLIELVTAQGRSDAREDPITALREILSEPRLHALQLHVRERLERGSTCPCCGQLAKVYRRVLYGGMAAWLIKLVRAQGDDHDRWIQITETDTRGGDYAKLVYWGLIEACPEPPDDGRNRVGLWRTTDAGRDFALGNTRLPVAVFVYNGKLQTDFGEDGFDTSEQVSITKALGRGWDYRVLMSLTPQEAEARFRADEATHAQATLFEIMEARS